MSDSFSLEEISRPSEVSNSPFVDLPMTLNLWGWTVRGSNTKVLQQQEP